MKTIIYLLLLNLFTITSFAQTYNVKIHTAGETVFTQTTSIDSITFGASNDFICGSKILWGGEIYPTVLIGNRCWFAKNLNIGTRINADQNQNNNGIIEKYCYDNVERNCVTYGGLYQWDEAMQYSTTPGAQGICPPGWHIPTVAEFEALRDTIRVANNNNDNQTIAAFKALGQPGHSAYSTNSSGFSALLGGYFNGNFYEMYRPNTDNDWWHPVFARTFFYSSNGTGGNASTLNIYYNSTVTGGDEMTLMPFFTYHAGSIRCIKDQ